MEKIGIKIMNDDNSYEIYELDKELLTKPELRIMLKEKIEEYEQKSNPLN